MMTMMIVIQMIVIQTVVRKINWKKKKQKSFIEATICFFLKKINTLDDSDSDSEDDERKPPRDVSDSGLVPVSIAHSKRDIYMFI